MHGIFAALSGGSIASVIATWSDITVTFPTTSGTNEDRQINWTGGSPSRTLVNSWNSGGTLEYRIDAGAWTTYTQGGAGFSVNNGQTVGWRFTPGGNYTAQNAAVRVGGVLVDTFQMSSSGFP